MPVSTFGAFSEPGYLAVSDPYDKPKQKRPDLGAFRPGGKPKKEKYEGFVPLFVNEPYYDTLSKRPETKGEGEEEAAAPVPFRPSHPMKASVGLGDYYGTLGGVVPHVDDPGPNTKLKKGDVKHRLPNIRTNPCSKGTYGFIGTTLGERMGRQGRGVVGEYSYMSDPYSLPMTKAEVAARKPTFAPFKPSSGFKKLGPGTLGREVGKPYEYVPESDGIKGPRKKVERPALVPFRPSHPPKSGYNGTLGPYPGYVNDPVDPKLSKTSADAKKEREKLGSVPAWRPGGIAKEGPHPSVIMVNMRFKTTAF